jgi:hypothetical protein
MLEVCHMDQSPPKNLSTHCEKGSGWQPPTTAPPTPLSIWVADKLFWVGQSTWEPFAWPVLPSMDDPNGQLVLQGLVSWTLCSHCFPHLFKLHLLSKIHLCYCSPYRINKLLVLLTVTLYLLPGYQNWFKKKKSLPKTTFTVDRFKPCSKPKFVDPMKA